MDNIGHTRSAALGPIAICVEAHGGSIEDVFRRIDIPSLILKQPDLPLRLSDHYKILQAAARETGQANFGAVLGQDVQTLSLSDYGRSVMSAPTLNLCIERAESGLNSLMQTNTDLILFPVGSRLCWSMIFHTRGHEGRYQNELLAVSYLLNSLKGYLGVAWTPHLIRIIGSDRRRANELERIFNAPVRCGYDACGIEFDKKEISARIPDTRSSSPTPPHECAMQMPDRPDSFHAIRAAALIEVLQGTPSAESVAKRLGMSKRTLQRRLMAHDTTISRTIGQLQYERATWLVKNSSQSIAMISEGLGYSDPAHFTRAFRRWAGVPPNVLRSSDS